MAGGRPTKWRDTFCEQVIEHMAQGFSLESFAGEISVAAETCYAWQREKPEFSQAIKVGRAKAATVWEKRLAVLAATGEGNATACIFALKNRFPEAWRDKQDHEVSGPNGGPIETVTKIERTIVRPNAKHSDS